jgi:hypothetical protein
MALWQRQCEDHFTDHDLWTNFGLYISLTQAVMHCVLELTNDCKASQLSVWLPVVHNTSATLLHIMKSKHFSHRILWSRCLLCWQMLHDEFLCNIYVKHYFKFSHFFIMYINLITTNKIIFIMNTAFPCTDPGLHFYTFIFWIPVILRKKLLIDMVKSVG